MRIAWDVSPLAVPPTGVGHYVAESLRAASSLAGDDDLCIVALAGLRGRGQLARFAATLPPGVEKRLFTLPLARLPRAIANRVAMPTLELLTGSVDAFVSSDWLHARTRGLSVVVVHDLVPLRLPHTTIRGTDRALKPRLDAIRRADIVIVNSVFTGREVTGVLGVAEQQIVVARPGVSDAFRHAPPSAPGAVGHHPYVLSVATNEPRKNLAALVEAFALVRAALPEMMLVLVGDGGWGADVAAERIRALRLQEAVLRTGYVPQQALPGIVAGARVFCLTSLFEGFGMPVAEALAAGVPSVVSRHASLNEAAGDAAWRVSPQDPAAIAAAIIAAATDTEARTSAIARGRAHAARLTWTACAQVILAAVRRAHA